ncbi:MAG: hypothetical protein LBR79_04365 [Oscillospiraceae bacterium]|nr:hypothetical protein [Oscillospiraceae bacterium]
MKLLFFSANRRWERRWLSTILRHDQITIVMHLENKCCRIMNCINNY